MLRWLYGLVPWGIELRLAPGSLLSLGDPGATSAARVSAASVPQSCAGAAMRAGVREDAVPALAARPPADDDGGSTVG